MDRFISAQKSCKLLINLEIQNGHKLNHWMWFTFPQLSQLGKSKKSKYFGLENIDEAKKYFQIIELKNYYLENVQFILTHIKNINSFLNPIDLLKFHSSLTLFHLVEPTNEIINKAISVYFNGELDGITIKLL